MEPFVNALVQAGVEIIVIVLGALLSLVSAKAVKVLNTIKKKDETGIVDAVTDAVVNLAEKELSGAKGLEKRDYAVKKAVEILHSKGLKSITEAEILAGIEAGVKKMPKEVDTKISIDGLS
ncbi:holin [Bacillus phage SP8]|uniref:Holin/anti-holin protein n=1 Tax=Bacillus phage Adastra TaxID=3143958 RepID=A0AAU8BDF2_9CAUD|nr:holin [Bacillus phage SP8]